MGITATPYVIASGSHTAELFRDEMQASLTGTGVVNPGDLAVSQNGTPNMSVNVAQGQAVVPGTLGAAGVFGTNLTAQTGYTGPTASFTQQGCYYDYNNATVNLTISAADPTNPRIDLVCLSNPDAQYSGASNTPVLQVITGTPAPSPSPPTVPASSLVLAQIAVAANASSIVTANISDQRPHVAPLVRTPVYASMYLNAAQQLGAGVTATVAFDTIVNDPTTLCSTVNHNITIKVAGRYLASWGVAAALNNNPQDFTTQLAKNAAVIRQGSRFVLRGGTTNDAMESVGSAHVNLAVGDVITINAYNGGSGVMNLSNGATTAFVDLTLQTAS